MEINLELPSEIEGSETYADAVSERGRDPSPIPAEAGGDVGGWACHTPSASLYNQDGPLESPPALNDSPLIFFSLEDARNLVAERDRLLRQYEDVNRKVQALEVLIPDHMREKVFGGRSGAGSPLDTASHHGSVNGKIVEAPPPPLPPSLDDSIVEMLDDCLEVMSQDQIEMAVWDIPEFCNKEKYNPEEIAKSLEKISRRGRITKRGMNYSSKQIAFNGRLAFSGPTLVQATENILRASSESLEPWEIIDKLKSDVDVGERVKQKPNGVYAALSRLASRRIAYRDADGGYRIGAK